MRLTFETGSHGLPRSRPLVLEGYGSEGSEARSSLENPSVSLADPKAWASIFGDWRSAAGVSVNADVAMSVPAIWCAVTFLAGSLAALPLRLHRKSVNGKETIERGALAALLAGKVNDQYLNTFNWRRDMMTSTLLRGRGMTFVETRATGDAMWLWPLEFDKTTVRRRNRELQYAYRDTSSSKLDVYTAGEVIDIKMLGKPDGVGAYDPVNTLKDTIGLAVAIRSYGSRFFLNGGVPPLALSGPAASPQAVTRGKSDMNDAVKQSTRDESNIVYLPTGHTLTPLGFNPEKSQLLEAQRFIVEEVARIYNLPPAFLHHLVNATYSNVEQQDIAFVKHVLIHWVQQWEQDLNLKLFGTARGRYVEFDLQGLLRGDFLSRMQAYAAGIQAAVLKPNEARRRENLPDDAAGNQLMINGAITPIVAAGDPAATGNPGGGELDDPAPEPDPEDPQA